MGFPSGPANRPELNCKRAEVSGLSITVPQMAGCYTPMIANLLSIVEEMVVGVEFAKPIDSVDKRWRLPVRRAGPDDQTQHSRYQPSRLSQSHLPKSPGRGEQRSDG